MSTARAGIVELSGSIAFNQSNYGDSNFQWTRRWSLSAGYYFFALSEIEFEWGDTLYRTKILGLQDTTFHDQVYSVNWVQTLAPKSSILQPYVKIGLGQLHRESTGTYATGGSPPAIVDSLTGVLGAGLRFYLLKQFAIRVEGTTYLYGGSLASWQDNYALNAGVSFYF